MRGIAATLTLVGVLMAAQPAVAKGPAMTWEFLTDQPEAEEPVVVELRMWEWGPDGAADTTRPWGFPEWFRERLDLDLELRPTDGEERARDASVPVPPFERAGPAVYRTTVRLPRPGVWRLGWKGGPWGGEETWLMPSIRVHRADPTGARGAYAGVVALSGLLVGAALLERRRARERFETRPRGAWRGTRCPDANPGAAGSV